jgi:hypothetical protein
MGGRLSVPWGPWRGLWRGCRWRRESPHPGPPRKGEGEESGGCAPGHKSLLVLFFRKEHAFYCAKDGGLEPTLR